MKFVVIGGTGLIGSQLVKKLSELDLNVLSASPASGVNTITGEGLSEALVGADVVVDVSNSPSFEDAAVMKFFQTSTTNIIAAAAHAAIKHFVAISIVGAERLPDSGYLRAKLAQEDIIKKSGIPYTILRSTQFFEFAPSIANAATVDGEVVVPTGNIQPIASEEVVNALLAVVTGPPLNTTVEVAGPVRMSMSKFIGQYLHIVNDKRHIHGDPHARYFGAELDEHSLVPLGDSYLGKIRYENWLHPQLVAVNRSSS